MARAKTLNLSLAERDVALLASGQLALSKWADTMPAGYYQDGLRHQAQTLSGAALFFLREGLDAWAKRAVELAARKARKSRKPAPVSE